MLKMQNTSPLVTLSIKSRSSSASRGNPPQFLWRRVLDTCPCGSCCHVNPCPRQSNRPCWFATERSSRYVELCVVDSWNKNATEEKKKRQAIFSLFLAQFTDGVSSDQQRFIGGSPSSYGAAANDGLNYEEHVAHTREVVTRCASIRFK